MKPSVLLSALFLVTLCGPIEAAENPFGLPDGLYTEITTERGVVVCELFYQKTPMTVASYVGLAEGTLGPVPRKPFFEGLSWHRVVPDFVVQGGDPTGRGNGGAGYQFPDEFVPGLRHDSPGVLQMANGGPDSNGSQHCLMLSAQQRLNYLHTVFGHVVRGLEVLPKVQQGDTLRVKILRLGSAAQAFRADEATFSELVAKAKRYAGPREPGPDAPFDDPDKLLPTDIPRATHFNFKLVNFERFTGRKIVARLFAKAPVGTDASEINGYLRGLAEKLGVAKAGALAVYFADRDEWRLWIGDDSAAAFASGPATPEGSAARPRIDRVQQEFLAAARKTAAEFITKAGQNAPPDRPLTAGQRIKFQVDAVLDGVIFRMESK